MDRNYQRVAIGAGAFHNPPRAKYSEETRNLIKLLMEESKLTMMQRKSIQDAVDRGESLPRPTDKTGNANRSKSAEPKTMYPSVWRKRSQEMIVNSGAYEREQFRRTAPLINKEKQKRHLACMMAYGKDMPETPHGPKVLHSLKEPRRLPDNLNPVQDLIQGIRERMEFLDDMECLGMGHKYRPIIQQEVAHKIRMLRALDKQKSTEVSEELAKFKYERPPPKPFPLGDLEVN